MTDACGRVGVVALAQPPKEAAASRGPLVRRQRGRALRVALPRAPRAHERARNARADRGLLERDGGLINLIN